MNELFLSECKLPNRLSEEELNGLFKKFKEGSNDAKNTIIEHNIRLVLYEVITKFNNVHYDKKDIVSIGNVGLIKAVLSYNPDKNVKFPSYALKCIDNEILMFLQKIKKGGNILYIEDYKRLEHTLIDDTNIVNYYERLELYDILNSIIKDLPSREKQIIIMYFGFYKDEIYTQKEIAGKFGISQSYVSKLISRTVEKIGNKLKTQRLIDEKPYSKKLNKHWFIKELW